MRVFSLLSCALIAGVASAQPQTGLLEWQVSADGGVTWSTGITVSPGDSYRIRAIASWTDGSTPSIGIAGVIIDQIDLIGADASDVFGGASGPGGDPVSAFRIQSPATDWTLMAGTGASADGLRIHRRRLESDIVLAQAFPRLGGVPNPDFKRDNPLEVVSFTAIAGLPKTLTIASPYDTSSIPGWTPFFLYITEAGSSTRTAQPATIAAATITIVPAPATAVLLALPTFRRRRTQP